MTRRLAAVTLVCLALGIFLGALVLRQLEVAAGDPQGRAQTYLYVGAGLAVLAVLASGLLRTRIGITLGWVLLALTLLSAVLLPAMAGIAAIFGALWVAALHYGRRMDDMTEQWLAESGGAEEGRGEG